MSGLTLSAVIQQQMIVDAYLSGVTNTALTLTATKVKQFEQQLEVTAANTYVSGIKIIEFIRKFAKMKDYLPNLIEKGLARVPLDPNDAGQLANTIKTDPVFRKVYTTNAVVLKKDRIKDKIEQLIKNNNASLREEVFPKNDCYVILNSTPGSHDRRRNFAGMVNELAFDFCLAYAENVAKKSGENADQKAMQAAHFCREHLLGKRVVLADSRKRLWLDWNCDTFLLEYVRNAVKNVDGFKDELLKTDSKYILYMGGFDALTTYVINHKVGDRLNQEDAYTGVLWNGEEGKNMLGRCLMQVRKECGGTGEVAVPKRWRSMPIESKMDKV